MEEQIEEHGGAETVGLVFTDRRITAMALHNYFLHRSKEVDKSNWTRAGKARRENHARDCNIHDDGGQFADATEEVQNSANMGQKIKPVTLVPEPAHKSDDMDEAQFNDADEEVEFPFAEMGKSVAAHGPSTCTPRMNGKSAVSSKFALKHQNRHCSNHNLRFTDT